MQQAESRAIADVFGPAASDTPVVATKGRIGHACAGTEAMEVIASLLALEHDRLFPTDDAGGLPSSGQTEDGWNTAGDSFLSLSMFGRGLGSSIVVGAFRE